jgi:membrane associated rhomboid family serine protease
VVTDQFTTCHFHPDRRAGVVCQRCDKPICPSCMTQASVGFHCPECTRQRGQRVVRGRAAFGGATAPTLTYALIGITVAAYFLQVAAGDVVSGGFVQNRAIVEYSLNGYAVAEENQWYRIVTSAFLHGGILHLALNMFALWNLGRIVEQTLGRLRFVLIYAVSLLAGSTGALVLNPDLRTVGASGAIYGLFGALVLLFRSRGISLWQSGLAMIILLNFVFTITVPNISIGGHAGGFAGGIVAVWLLLELPRRTKDPRHALYAVAALLPLLVIAAVVAASGWTRVVPTG